jgi:hypothetical protein
MSYVSSLINQSLYSQGVTHQPPRSLFGPEVGHALAVYAQELALDFLAPHFLAIAGPVTDGANIDNDDEPQLNTICLAEMNSENRLVTVFGTAENVVSHGLQRDLGVLPKIKSRATTHNLEVYTKSGRKKQKLQKDPDQRLPESIRSWACFED